MSVQPLIVDVVVAAAALWLVWSFGPVSLRRAVRRRQGRGRAVKPGYDVALRADGLAGKPESADDRCGPDCGCG